MQTLRITANLATLAVLLLTACAMPLADASRIHLGDRSFLELRLPRAWELRVVYSLPSGVKTVRVFSESGEPLEIEPITWSADVPDLPADSQLLRERGRQLVLQHALCDGAIETMQERMLQLGLALYCRFPRSAAAEPKHVGVLVTANMTARFVFVPESAAQSALIWQVLGSIHEFN